MSYNKSWSRILGRELESKFFSVGVKKSHKKIQGLRIRAIIGSSLLIIHGLYIQHTACNLPASINGREGLSSNSQSTTTQQIQRCLVSENSPQQCNCGDD